MTPSFKDKLAKTGPRKLLALDGGGIRGVITLGVLAEIEKQLQVQFGRNEDFVLADYFDYIAGTSTGAIIGTCLAVGMRVGEVTRFYQESGPEEVRRINAAILVTPQPGRRQVLLFVHPARARVQFQLSSVRQSLAKRT
jgi:patatin-like phospholipase/acyl hydrolase